MKFVLSLIIFVVVFVVDEHIFNIDVVEAVELSLDDRSSDKSPSKNGKEHVNNGHHYGNNKTDQHKKKCTSKYGACVKNKNKKKCCVGTCVNTTLGYVCYCNQISENCTVNNNATCCQGYCDSVSATCKCIVGTGQCKFGRECCSGKCTNSNCECAASGGACKVTNDCCEGICRNGICGTCLNEMATGCGTANECCKGSCTDNACICGSQNDLCNNTNDCCGGTCNNGVCSGCMYYPGAASAGVNCNPTLENQCCYGTCKLSTTDGFICTRSPLNSECNSDEDCATNVCEKNRCSCRDVGEPCGGGSVQCCKDLTCTDNDGNPTCQN